MAPASPVPPITRPRFSAALTVSSVATAPITGAAGAWVSTWKFLEDAAATDALPAASVCVADTVIVPSPSLLRSPDSSTTATGVAPLPVTVLVTVPVPLVKLTAMLAPASPTTVTTPPAAVASAAVAPSATPVPNSKPTVTLGAVLSIVTAPSLTTSLVTVTAGLPSWSTLKLCRT